VASLEIRTFGGLDVSLGGDRIASFEARSAEALLVYLAHAVAPVQRDVLAHLLWPERSREVARANLRSAAHRLRRALPDHVVASRATIGLDAAWTDARALETAMRSLDRHEAVALYRGDFLEGFTLDGSPGFDAWVAMEAERYRDLVAGALQELVSAALEADDVDGALRHGRQLLRIDPLHEGVHRALARALAHAGRRSTALAHLDACARAMRAEFGLEPDPASSDLATAIRQRLPAAEGAATSSDGPPREASARRDEAAEPPRGPRRHHHLPSFAGPFLGRGDELELIARRVADVDCRWLTVMGPGGVGKTRLAVEAAAAMADAFPDGVRFVGLAGVRDVEHVAHALASALGLDPLPPGDALEHVAAFVRAKHVLLVIDNLEHVVGAAPLLAALVRGAPSVRVVATSRVRLHLAEEWLLVLDGLSDAAAAERLFVHHATRTGAAVGAEQAAGAVGEICALVEHMPLALELAATWANVLPLERIVASLRQQPTRLAAPRPDAPERHRSLAATFDGSWDLLDESLRAVFARLGVFRGGFTTAEAASVALASEADLLALVDRSLVRTRGDGRYDLHELIRQYALGRLAERGEVEETARRHLHAYLAIARSEGPELFGAGLERGLARLRVEADNVRAALTWGLEHASEADAALELVVAMEPYWRLACAIDEAQAWLARAAGWLDAHPHHAAAVRSALGHFAWMVGDLDEAESALSGVVDGWDRTTPVGRSGRAKTLASLAMTAWSQRRFDVASAWCSEALAETDGDDASWWRALALGWLGKAAVGSGDVDAARRWLDASVTAFARLGNPWGMGMFVGSAAHLHLLQGDLDGALRMGETATTLLERVGFKHALAPTYELLSVVAERQARPAEAERRAAQAIAVYRDLGDVSAAHDVAERRRGTPFRPL
jgi:predicted ATPase/DNA-binding SARP family transcriptional activator